VRGFSFSWSSSPVLLLVVVLVVLLVLVLVLLVVLLVVVNHRRGCGHMQRRSVKRGINVVVVPTHVVKTAGQRTRDVFLGV
jgi:hypothetical protein